MESKYSGTSLEIDRETGKRLIFSPDSTPAEKSKGILLLYSACNRGDPESQYFIGKMLLKGTIALKGGDSRATAMDLLLKAARKEYRPARTLLSNYCMDRYNRAFPAGQNKKQPLTDFDGKRIIINHTGKFVPVDAVLEYTAEGKNVLTFSLDLAIFDNGAEVADLEKLYEAIIKGIRMWEGDYIVFGGQQLQIKIDLSANMKLYDNVVVALMAGGMLKMVNKALAIQHSERAIQTRNAILDKRSMAIMGFKKWSVRTRKIIYLHSQTDRFDDYDEITHVIKHEFGHVLGLGDLYEEAEAGLSGVSAGQYPELDCFALTDQFFNLVMCDHHGPISNNDIEMVVLAFSENQIQQYQPTERLNTISKALGRGN